MNKVGGSQEPVAVLTWPAWPWNIARPSTTRGFDAKQYERGTRRRAPGRRRVLESQESGRTHSDLEAIAYRRRSTRWSPSLNAGAVPWWSSRKRFSSTCVRRSPSGIDDPGPLEETMSFNKDQWIDSFESQLAILRPHLTERVLASMSVDQRRRRWRATKPSAPRPASMRT